MKKRRIMAIFMAIAMFVTLLPASITTSMATDFAPIETFGATDPVVFTKEFLPAALGQPAKIKLEAYATGATSTTQSTMPADIVLVLDQSGSMDESINGTTKLNIMKNAVNSFVSEVASFNTLNDDSYRLAIVGFASESGYGDNTEILTVYNTQTITSVNYSRITDITTLDTSKTYYIQSGNEYSSIDYYENPVIDYNWFTPVYGDAGWYTNGSFTVGDKVNIQSTAIYERVTVTNNVPATTPGISYGSLTNNNYADAFVNCTYANITTGGVIAEAITQLDGEGATRTDLGMQMAKQIFDSQSAGTYANRKKIVVVITDGVPTTQTDFNVTVANNAISAAKAMKDSNTHIFSMYLGTPSSNSVNFLQALSSNYPNATDYNTLGTKFADSYYSAHTQGSAVTNVFHDIAFSITSNSTLDEKSVVTDTISEGFRLPVSNGYEYNREQISVYTVDKMANGWALEEKPFTTATVEIKEGKTINVTGFNFGYHCVTESPKDSQGGTDYGRKLVIYIPIVEDENADTFGGYLPTNNGAGIYQNAESTTPVITAENKYENVSLRYNLLNDEMWQHIGTETSYTLSYNATTLNAVLANMIPSFSRPNGFRNEGVSMAYYLVDTNLSNDTNDDTVIAMLSVNPGQSIDVTNFDNWTLANIANAEKTLTINSGENIAEAMFRLDCVLQNKNDYQINLVKSSYLDVEMVNENVHIVGGIIDEGGTLTVEPAVEGSIVPGIHIGNTYREEVTAGIDTAKMVFKANPGYEISEIIHVTSSSHDSPLDIRTPLYDLENGVNNVSFEADGSYIFQVTNVQSGHAIEVYTRPIVYTLTTAHDDGSIIMDGTRYSHHDTEILEVFFKANEGYSISSVWVDGYEYDASMMLSNTTLFNLTIDGDGILSGDVHLSKQSDHSVIVTSVKRKYDVTYKYYQQQDNGTFVELNLEQETYSDVEFGSALPMPAVDTNSKLGYTLKGWFETYKNSEFAGVVNLSEIAMPAKDVVYHAFWEKNPDQTFIIPTTGTLTKKLLNSVGEPEANGAEVAFTFRAVFHERVIGESTIILGANDIEKQGSPIEVSLTGLEYARFNSGDPIYVYEVHDSGNSTWIYDDARYAVYSNGTINNINGTETQIVFTNQKAPYLVNYDLAGGNIGGNMTISPKIVDYTDANLLCDRQGTPISDPVKDQFKFTGWKKGDVVVDNTKSYGELAGAENVTSITLVAQYERIETDPSVITPVLVKYIVEHYRVNTNGEYPTTPNDTETKIDKIGEKVTAVAKTGGDYENYCVDEVISNPTKSATLVEIKTPADIVTLKLYYDVDVIGGGQDPDEGDNIPDIYQKKITFRIINGTWDGVSNTDIVKVVDLLEGGVHSKTGTSDISNIIPNVSKAVAAPDHDTPGEWRETPPATVSGTEPVVYTFVFYKTPDVLYDEYNEDEPEPTPQSEEYAENEKIQVDPNGGVWNYNGQSHTTVQTIELKANIDLGTPTRDGYVFMGWEKTNGTGEIVHVYTAQWEEDKIGTIDPDDGDDVADVFQKKVIFKVVNGTWADNTTADIVNVVNLLDENGNYSKTGQADITGYVPTGMKANYGYGNGTWDVTLPSTVTGTDTVTYTYSFERTPGSGGSDITIYTLTYETNGGNKIDSEIYAAGTIVDLVKVPVREGYIFDGWHIDRTLIEDVSSVVMNKNITVYASWIKINEDINSGYETPSQLNAEDHFAYIVGFADGTVRPNANISRAEVTTIFFRLLKPAELRENNLTTWNNYKDVDENAWYNTAISTMTKLGIVEGRTVDVFAPTEFITRAEFAAICARFDDSEYTIIDNFTDIDGHWAEAEIHEAAAHGWIKGYDDGTFKPDQFITRAEAMTMINRVLNRIPETADDLLADMIKWPDNSDKSAWYYLAVQEATNSHNYYMKDHNFEKWTSLREVPDWTKYE